MQGIVHEEATFQVEVFPLNHRIECWGFRFQQKPLQRPLIAEKLPEGFPVEQIPLLKQGIDVPFQEDVVKALEVTLPSLPSKSYAYLSDTAVNERYFHAIANCTWLYHEATFLQIDASKAMATGHSTAHQAAEVAKKTGAKNLLLGHFSSRYLSEKEFLNEAQSLFPSTYAATEGVKINI